MFRQLTNFGFQRSPVQAIGFYLVYLVTGVLLIAMLAAGASVIVSGFGGGLGFDGGLQFGSILAVLMTAILAATVLQARGLLRHVGYLFVGVLSVVGAVVGGLILGLIFVAFLTTRSTRQAASVIDAEARRVEASGAF